MSFFGRERDYDMFDDEDSDSNVESSSDDDIDTILNGTQEQRKKLKQLHNKQINQRSFQKKKTSDGQSLSSNEDEFEREMNAELEKNVKSLEDSRGDTLPKLAISAGDAPPVNPAEAGTSTLGDTFYDEIYFDSDEEDGETKKNRQPETLCDIQ